ncbi:MAG: membrane or secreted protein, partial [Ignavibacteria bacterium]|nr:membrane or secreted protein [Ignavibacteria bacterium]
LDVAQMVRLGLDAFRVHVWDREISDRDGNLLKNEHLDLFDYLMSKLAANGIKSIITPIAWWGTGWPEPDVETPGFSQIYSKMDLITSTKAREAQRKYLNQFINHINPYTNHSYKDELSVIAIEIINEPKHPNNELQVTEYVNEMYDVLRTAGITKPIFYNISENWNTVQANAVSKSKAEGVSFQWYPTGLVHGKMLEGNYLINVNKYKIPSEGIEQFFKKAKMVYEFDAADIGASYMYPAMARSYREAGMQFATMFSYDPSQIAWSNTEYPTHYLNLLYTPSKAISLLIAGKAFHSLKLNKSFGEFPTNNNFDEYTVSASEDLSVMNNDTSFYYSNNT